MSARQFDRCSAGGEGARRALSPHTLAAAIATALGAVAVGAAPPAGASGSRSANATLSLRATRRVLSVTVSPSSGSFGSCSGGDRSRLSFPNGSCRTPSGAGRLVITNGGAAARVMVSGADLAPVGGGSVWVLCGSSDRVAPACAGAGKPGSNQYRLRVIAANGRPGEYLSNRAQCDRAFVRARNCHAAPRRRTAEVLALTGPASTTNTATRYTATITWTVAAP